MPHPGRRINKAEIAEQQARCYELCLAGHNYRVIAETVGVSLAKVSKLINEHLALRVQPLADELRAVTVDRLDRYLVKLDSQIQAGVSVARNVEVAVKVEERRAKLLGIDAPQVVEATVHQVDQTDMAIAELVREAQAAAAVEEAALREGAPDAG
jgi:hypothetical protein